MTRYRLKNWSKYNRFLVQRGSITLYFSPDVLKKWKSQIRGKRGRPQTYSDEMILCALMLREVFDLPLRALQGFLLSLISLMTLDLPVPHYSQICRRAQRCAHQLKRLSRKQPTRLVFDSTGFKVLGEGEWLVRKYGSKRKRGWKKVHLAMCPDSHDIHLVKVDDRADCQVFEELFAHCPRSVRDIYGDGAFDSKRCRKSIADQGKVAHIPPPKNARLLKEKDSWQRLRNEAVKIIAGFGGGRKGRSLWGKLFGYSLRSVVETTMMRLKTLFGHSFKSRTPENLSTEIFVKSLIINKFNKLGLPHSVPVW